MVLHTHLNSASDFGGGDDVIDHPLVKILEDKGLHPQSPPPLPLPMHCKQLHVRWIHIHMMIVASGFLRRAIFGLRQ